MKKLLIIAVLALMLIVTACGSETVEDTNNVDTTDIPTDTNAEVEYKSMKTIEIRMDRQVFEPSTIEIDKNELVRLVFMDEEPYTFSIPALDITTTAGIDVYVDLEVEEAGTYQYVCLDCKENTMGVLRVLN